MREGDGTRDREAREESPRPLPEQQSLDFLRAEQLRLLRDCELPKDKTDKTGHGISAQSLKLMLLAIDQYGRGRAGGAFASVETLRITANVGKRTATRALEVLEALGLICRQPDGMRRGRLGSPTNRYTIVWSELAILCRDGLAPQHAQPTAHRPNQSAPNVAEHSARGPDQSALGADQSALGADQSALGADQSAPRGAQSVFKRRETTLNAPTVDPPRRGEDGAREARIFLEHERAAVADRANRINRWANSATWADRELVVKLAVLWEDGELSDNAVEQVLESYQRKRDAGDPVKKPMAWLWTAMRDQCQREGINFQRLLATCQFPRDMAEPPGRRLLPAE